MPTKKAIVGAASGLHARPASLFVKKVKETGLEVTIAKKDGKAVNAASILGVMSLGVYCGDEIKLTAIGDNADQVLAELCEFLESDLDAKTD